MPATGEPSGPTTRPRIASVRVSLAVTGPLSPSFKYHATVGIALGYRPEDEVVLGRRQPVERGDAVGAGRRVEDPAREVDLAPPALLVEQPGVEADPGQGLAVAVDRLDAGGPGAVESQRDRRGKLRGRAPPLSMRPC